MKFFNLFKRKNNPDTKLSPFGGEYRRKAGRGGNNGGALLAARPRKTLLTVLAATLCSVCLVVTGLGISSLNANAGATGTNIGAISGTTSFSTTNKTAVTNLFKKLGDDNCTNYVALKNYYDNVNSTRNAVNINSYVTFAGYRFQVVYGSKADDGRVIATLWGTDIPYSVYWTNNGSGTGWSSSSTTTLNPSNMYSGSYARCYLNGGYYFNGTGGQNGVGYYGSTGNSEYCSPITTYFSDCIVTPSQVSWQLNQTKANYGGDYDYPNDAASAISNGTYGSGGSYHGKGYASSNTQYLAWANDKLWLPSIREVGTLVTNNAVNIWGMTATMRAEGSRGTMLRTGGYGGGNTAYCITKDGAGSYFNVAQITNDYQGYRPALHLDLYKVAKKVGLAYESLDVPTWWSTQPSYVTRDSSDYTKCTSTYTGAQNYVEVNARSATLLSWSVSDNFNSHKLNDSTGNGSDRIYFTDAGSYTATASIKSTLTSQYAWEDCRTNTSATRSLTLTVNRLVLSPIWNFNQTGTISYPYNGSGQAPYISSIATNVTTTVNGKTQYVGAPEISAVSVYYYGTTYSYTGTGTAWGSSSSLQSSKPSTPGYYYSVAKLSTTQANNMTFSSSFASPLTANNSTTSSKYFNITRALLTFTWDPSGTASYTYDPDKKQGPTISEVESSATDGDGNSVGAPTANGISVYYNGTQNDGNTFGNNTTNTAKPKPAGSYTATARLTTTQAQYYTFNASYTSYSTNNSTDTSRVRTKSFTIGKKSVTAHVWDSNSSNQKGGATYVDSTHVTATYKAAAQYAETYSASAKTDTIITWELPAGTSWTNNFRIGFTDAGSYSIKQTINTYNYQWSDAATNTAAERYLYITAYRAVLSVTWDPSTDSLYYIYNGSSHAPVIDTVTSNVKDSNGNSVGAPEKTAISVYYSGNTYSYTGAATAWGNNTTNTTKPSAAGIYTATARLTTDQAKNYTFNSSYASPTATNSGTTTTKSFTIRRAVLSLTWDPSTDPLTYIYDGDAHAPVLNKVESSAKDDSGNSVGAPAKTAISVYYSGNTYSYTGTATAWGNNTTNTTKPSVAGVYTATARLTNAQAANYTFSSSYVTPSTNNNSSGRNTSTKSFTINRAVLTLTWNPSTDPLTYTYSGKAQGPDLNKVETNATKGAPTTTAISVYYSGTTTAPATFGNDTTNKTKPTNAGSYTATARLTDAQAANYTFNSSYVSPSTNNGVSGRNTSTKTFTINRKSVTSGVTWEEVNDCVYSGNAYTPKPTVTKITTGTEIVSVTSSYTTDFSYEYKNNTNAGTATVTVTALTTGNYADSKEFTFTIAKAVITGVVWDKLSFTYNGSEQCPKLTQINTATEVESEFKPVSMFKMGYGQINVGTHTITATLRESYAKNFTTSSTDTEATQIKAAYEILKAALSLIFGDTDFTYDGLAHQPDFTVTANNGKDVKNLLDVAVTANSASHLTYGEAVDVGSYNILVTMPEELKQNYQSASWNTDFAIAQCKLKINWTATEYTYNGAKQGAEVAGFAGMPTYGEDPFYGLVVTYFDENGAIKAMPVHAGEYSVKVALANDNYVLDCDVTKDFVIKSVSFTGNGGMLIWNGLENLAFTGMAQAPTLYGEYTGLFTADADRTLDLSVTYAVADGDGNPADAFSTEKFINKGKYLVRIEESYGDYTFEDVPFEIKARGITVVWLGDELSHYDVDTYKWMYDGAKHAPGYSVKFDGEDEGVKIYRDGKQINTLAITYGNRTNVGEQLLTAALTADEYNSNFEIVAGATQKMAIERFVASKIEWYEQGGEDPLSDGHLESLRYEYSRVHGRTGPKLVAKAVGYFDTDESGTITRTIDLTVTYPKYFDGYWQISETPYSAQASFKSVDLANSEMADDVRDSVSFLVTELRLDLEKITIYWVINVDGVETDITTIGEFSQKQGYGWLDGEFTFVYNGEVQFPVPRAVGESNNHVSVAAGDMGRHKEVGNGYTVYLKSVVGYEIAGGLTEMNYGIAPKEITVDWEGEDTFVFGEDPLKRLRAVAQEATSVDIIVTVDGIDAGMHTATAAVYTDGKVDANYKLINDTKAFEITRKPVSARQIVWTAEGANAALDSEGNKYYVFRNDGLLHAPTAELKVYVGAEEKTISLTVMGAQSAAGTYTAYAILDEGDEYNSNLILVVNENAATLVETIASQKFEISRVAIKSVQWTTAEGEQGTEKLNYVYNGKSHLPYAVGTTTDNRTVVLTVWGAQINAGEYVAYVTDNFAFEADASRTAAFTISPKKVTVEWQERDEKGEIHFTYDGTVKHPEVTVGGNLTEDDYFVTGFVNAGSYVSAVVFTNANYTYDNTESEEANICEFIIDKREIAVEWTGKGNHTPAGAESGVMYWYYNGEERGPLAGGSFGNIRFGEDAENRIIVSGREVNAGSYTATATLDTRVAANANYTLTNVTKRFVISPFEVRVIWTGNEEADGAFEWEYDGDTHHPTARYKLWNSGADEWIYVDEEVQGAKKDVGEYIASIILPQNCAFEVIGGKSCGEQAFSITKHKVNKIEWYSSSDENADRITDVKNFAFEYTGLSQVPVARVAETGAELLVTGARINAGTGYIATAALKDAGNYEFGYGVNSTYTFGISPKKVMVLWDDSSDLGSFNWTYTGSLICPTASFTDVEGNKVDITVTGGRINQGTYTAQAHDTFLNYDFSTEVGNLTERTFHIQALILGANDFEWFANGGAPAADGSPDTYVFTYNGAVQQPIARCTNQDLTLFFGYTVIYDGRTVSAIVNVGTYTITVKASDGNYTIPQSTVTVIIEPKEVAAIWGATTLTYTGSAQAPTAHYVDVNGQCILLQVSGQEVDVADGYVATADFAATDNKYKNYVLVADTTAYDIKAKTTASFKWDWATGKFVIVPEIDKQTLIDDRTQA